MNFCALGFPGRQVLTVRGAWSITDVRTVVYMAAFAAWAALAPLIR